MNTTDKLAAADALADAAKRLSDGALPATDGELEFVIDPQDLAELDAALRAYHGKEKCLACDAGDAELGPQHDDNCPQNTPF